MRRPEARQAARPRPGVAERSCGVGVTSPSAPIHRERQATQASAVDIALGERRARPSYCLHRRYSLPPLHRLARVASRVRGHRLCEIGIAHRPLDRALRRFRVHVMTADMPLRGPRLGAAAGKTRNDPHEAPQHRHAALAS